MRYSISALKVGGTLFPSHGSRFHVVLVCFRNGAMHVCGGEDGDARISVFRECECTRVCACVFVLKEDTLCAKQQRKVCTQLTFRPVGARKRR